MISLLLAAVLAAATPDAAPAPAPAPAAAPAPLTADQLLAQAKAEAAAKYVCRMETATGARLPKKVCRSKDEMARKAAEDQEGLRQKQMTGGLQR